MLQSIIQLLWNCLTPGMKMSKEAGVIIWRLHSLCCPYTLVEDLLLQQISGLVPTFSDLQKLVNLLEITMDASVQHPLNRYGSGDLLLCTSSLIY